MQCNLGGLQCRPMHGLSDPSHADNGVFGVTQEQKKLRKQRREEREKEKQELIRQVKPRFT